jgi:hypothetical protein
LFAILPITMRIMLLSVLMVLAGVAVAQKRDRFTLYDEHSGAPKRINEGKYIEIAVKADRCAGWEQGNHSYSGDLLLVDSSSVTIFYEDEYLNCYAGDSSFTLNRVDLPDGTTLTIKNDRILWIERDRVAGNVFGAIAGAAFVTVLFVAPLASVKWFNGWGFNTDTYTTIAQGGLIVAGASIPLVLVFGTTRRLVPKDHAVP